MSYKAVEGLLGGAVADKGSLGINPHGLRPKFRHECKKHAWAGDLMLLKME